MRAQDRSPTPLSSHAEALATHGYVIIDNLLSPARVRAINDELAPHLDAKARAQGDFFGWNTTRLAGVLSKSRIAQELALHETIMPIVHGVLEPNCDYVQLNLTEVIRIHPGERAQAPHRDEEMWPAPKQCEWTVNVIWALDDFTEENGATRLWPKSHGAGLGRDAEVSASIAAEMPAGSALIYLGSFAHCGGANKSTRSRTGLVMAYCLGWLKTYENQFLAYPPHMAKDFTPELRELIGYRMHRPNLGHWNGQDPSVLFGAADPNAPFLDALPPAIAEELRNYYRAAA